MRGLPALAICLLSSPALAQSVDDCGWQSSAASIAEPWEENARSFAEGALNLTPHERIVGFIHIGTETTTPPERPRPDVKAKTTWL